MSDPIARAASPSGPLIAASGAVRRVGVEIEFLGLSARRAAEVIAEVTGGRVAEEDPHAFGVRGTELGDLSVETDLRYLHPRRHPTLRVPPLSPEATRWFARLLAPFIPRELITRPIKPDQLRLVQDLITALRKAGAGGRGVVLLDSLSLHFNIEPPSLDARTLTAFLKAYMTVDPDLRRAVAHGWRKSAALPPDYPPAYRRRVLDDRYWPDLETFASDYLAANPTRKRALDLLPVLSVLLPDRVRRALPHEKIGPRPVLHYRLPQAHVGDPEWSLMPSWHEWLRVEALAEEQLRAAPNDRQRA